MSCIFKVPPWITVPSLTASAAVSTCVAWRQMSSMQRPGACFGVGRPGQPIKDTLISEIRNKFVSQQISMFTVYHHLIVLNVQLDIRHEVSRPR